MVRFVTRLMMRGETLTRQLISLGCPREFVRVAQQHISEQFTFYRIYDNLMAWRCIISGLST